VSHRIRRMHQFPAQWTRRVRSPAPPGRPQSIDGEPRTVSPRLTRSALPLGACAGSKPPAPPPPAAPVLRRPPTPWHRRRTARPPTARVEHTVQQSGDARVDDYAWLRKKKDLEVEKYLRERRPRRCSDGVDRAPPRDAVPGSPERSRPTSRRRGPERILVLPPRGAGKSSTRSCVGSAARSTRQSRSFSTRTRWRRASSSFRSARGGERRRALARVLSTTPGSGSTRSTSEI
jgi:hypothetical protein